MTTTSPAEETAGPGMYEAAASPLEKDELEDGHHDLKHNVGKTIGTFYIDYYAELT